MTDFAESNDTLKTLAEAAGLSVNWTDASGRQQTVSDDTLRTVLSALGLPGDTPEQAAESLEKLAHEKKTLPPLVTGKVGMPVELPLALSTPRIGYRIELEDGTELTGEAERVDDERTRLPALSQPGYHRLEIDNKDVTLAITPVRSPSIPAADPASGKGRNWALAAQLYSLRRADGAGIGDFSALAQLARVAGAQGACGLAISPVHAAFGAHPKRFSPYAPSSRLFINVLFIDPAAVFGEEKYAQAVAELGLEDDLAHLESLPLIDWVGVAKLRRAILRYLFDRFPANAAVGDVQDFQRFRERGGEALERHARFEVLQSLPEGGGVEGEGWHSWPLPLRDPRSESVARLARQHADEVRFQLFLQWLADRGLANAQREARAAGMSIGLIADLAVGTDPSGSHAWSRQADILDRLSPGAPPDLFNRAGQGWGLTAFSPRAMRQNGFAAFIEMLRATLVHAGGVRIDHALGLQRLWLVPEGASPTEGVYLAFPFDDMMNLISLEAWRHDAVVIGENLGTVPEGFDERIARAGMLGMSVLWFERGADGSFRAPEHWTANNVAMTTTHDLPTITGWWAGRDIDWRVKLDMLGDIDESTQRAEREQDKQALWRALAHEYAGSALPDDAPIAAAFDLLAKTPAPLLILPVEDLLGVIEQPNLPATIDTHPNWRQRLNTPVEQLFADPQVVQRLAPILHHRTSL
ncbi:4-alpha-glucanotransferase [Pigmentiphaga aceris]|nr:4-alpha-glucanotransferase [Pigmentiphaga aceris]